MVWKIKKQKGGLYGVWSTIADGWIATHCTRKELISLYKERAAKDHKKRLKDIPEIIHEECDRIDARS